MPVLGEEALRVELHADNRKLLMANGHNFLLAIRRFGPGRDNKIWIQSIRADDETVIARGGERIGEAGEDPLAVVMDLVGLAVHQSFGPDDDATGCLADGLMAKADTQQGNLAHELPDAFHRNARFGGCAGSWRDDQMARFLGGNLVRGDLVVAVDFNLQPRVDLPQPLDEVVGKGVVVIDEEDHATETSVRCGRFAPF
jgi:hypothetical protein